MEGRIHYHGWGIAWYIDSGLAAMVKEPRPEPKSPIAAPMDNGVRSHHIISHVRLASRGGLSIVNTHPSARRLWGRDLDIRPQRPGSRDS